VAALEANPLADPAPEYWREFSRELHLKLVQAAQDSQTAPVSASPRRFRLPYLLGAPALAVLLLYVAVQFTGPGAPIQDQAAVKGAPPVQMESAVQPAPAPPAAAKMAAAPALPMEPFVTVALEEGAPLPVDEVDISGWELEAELAGMTDQEKNAFLNKLHQRKKDGSCVEGFSLCSWG
jgi:hypothetical protein